MKRTIDAATEEQHGDAGPTSTTVKSGSAGSTGHRAEHQHRLGKPESFSRTSSWRAPDNRR